MRTALLLASILTSGAVAGCVHRTPGTARADSLLSSVGFDQRAAWGSAVLHIGPGEMEDDADLVDVIRTRGGVQIAPTAANPWGVARRRAGARSCAVQVYLNGLRVVPRDFGASLDFGDFLDLRRIDAVELHVGSDGPLHDPTGCGSLLLWSHVWTCRAPGAACRMLDHPEFVGGVEGRVLGTEDVGAVAVRVEPSGRRTVPDADGGFSFTRLLPGAYELVVMSSDGPVGRHPVRVFAFEQVRVELRLESRRTPGGP